MPPRIRTDLFECPNGPMTFNIKACSDVDLKMLIETGGGLVENESSEGPYTITLISCEHDSHAASWTENAFKSEFIFKCCTFDKILPLKNFWVKKSVHFNNTFNPNQVLQCEITWSLALKQFAGYLDIVPINNVVPLIKLKRLTDVIGSGSVTYTRKFPKRLKSYDFTDKERNEIVELMVKMDCFEDLHEDNFWKLMSKSFCNHTWQGLKEHFRRRIAPHISDFNLSTDVIQKFKSGWFTNELSSDGESVIEDGVSRDEGSTANEPMKSSKHNVSKHIVPHDSDNSSDSSIQNMCRRRPKSKNFIHNQICEDSVNSSLIPSDNENKQIGSGAMNSCRDSPSCDDSLSCDTDEDDAHVLQKQVVSWEWVEDNVDILEKNTPSGHSETLLNQRETFENKNDEIHLQPSPSSNKTRQETTPTKSLTEAPKRKLVRIWPNDYVLDSIDYGTDSSNKEKQSVQADSTSDSSCASDGFFCDLGENNELIGGVRHSIPNLEGQNSSFESRRNSDKTEARSCGVGQPSPVSPEMIADTQGNSSGVDKLPSFEATSKRNTVLPEKIDMCIQWDCEVPFCGVEVQTDEVIILPISPMEQSSSLLYESGKALEDSSESPMEDLVLSPSPAHAGEGTLESMTNEGKIHSTTIESYSSDNSSQEIIEASQNEVLPEKNEFSPSGRSKQAKMTSLKSRMSADKKLSSITTRYMAQLHRVQTRSRISFKKQRID